jgi:tRNA A37 threonylcarbamoyltransferase TsaD
MEKRRVRITALPQAKQGMQVKKEQTYLGGLPTNPDQYSVPDLSVGSFVNPVPRDQANIEAEKGETMITPMGDDAQTRTIPKTFAIGGNKHYNGGTPLNVPDGTFVFSDHLKETNVGVHSIFGKKEKKTGYTYAELSKPLMINEDIKRLIDKDSDKLSQNTARMNIQNKLHKLSLLSILQESKKGFGDGEEFDMPEVAMSYLEKTGLNIADAVDPYLKAIQQSSNQSIPQEFQTAKRGGPIRMKMGGGVSSLPTYQGGGDVKGLKPGHRINKATGEILDENGKVVGIVTPGGETGKVEQVAKSSVPDNAVVIKRSDYETEAEYTAARNRAFTESGQKTPVYTQGADGKYRKVAYTAQKFEPYTGELFKTVFNGNQTAADQYYYIEQSFNKPELKKSLQEKAISALRDPKQRRGLTESTAQSMIKKLEADPEMAYNQFMEMQKRNIGLMAHGVSANQLSNSPDKGKVTNKDFEAAFDKVGIKTPSWENAALQQASYIGYQNLLSDRDAGKIEDEGIKSALDKFTVTQVGKSDDIITGASGPGMISAIDGIYTNTTAGQIAGIKGDPMISELDPEADIATQQTRESIKYDPITGVENQNPYGWRAPDIKRLATAASWLSSDVPEMPWAKVPEYYIPNVYLDSPDARAFNERGKIAAMEQTLGAYTTPGAVAASASALSGAGNIGQYISQVGKENKETVNRHTYAVADIMNKAATERASLATQTNANRQVVNEKHRAFKRDAQKLFDDSFDWGWNQASRLSALNDRYENFKVDPFTGVTYKTGKANINPMSGNQSALMDRLNEYVTKYPNFDQKVLLEAAKSDLGMDTKYEAVPQNMNYGQSAFPPNYDPQG